MKLVENHNKTVYVGENLFWVIVVHLGVLFVCPFLFSWDALIFALITMALFAYSLGIFHHMLLTHRSFKCKKWFENLGALFGTLTARGPMASPIRYVAMHKIHHAYSDTELDPHTPTKGIFFALIGWFWQMPLGFTLPEFYEQYVPEMKGDRWMTFLDRNPHLLQLMWAVLCFGIGFGVATFFRPEIVPWVHGLSFAAYGVFFRTVVSYYLMNWVDVVNHTIGYRAYETKDQSTNSFIMAALHLGGAISWHNNHHAHQHYFTVKKNWWEFDIHHQFLKVMSLFGIVWDIQILDDYKRSKQQAAMVSPSA